MSVENIRNPATWLLELWRRLPRDDQAAAQSSFSIWTRVLESEHSPAQTLERLNCVFANAGQAQALVKRLQISDVKREQLLSWGAAFEGALVAAAKNHNWKTTVQHFTDERKVHLQYCSIELDGALDEKQRTTSKGLSELAEKIDGLLAELGDESSLEKEFRALVSDLLETARRAISEYRVRGNKGVFDSLAFIFSSLLRYREQFDTPEKQRWSSSLREVISVMADVATVTGYSAIALGPAISGFFPH